MATERTFIMVKPDGVARGLVGDVISRFERKGLTLEQIRMLEIDEDVRIAVARRSITSVVPPEELERLESSDEGESVDAGSAEPASADEPMTAEERDAARN